MLALPLSYIYARNVLVLYDSRPDKQAVREFLTWAHERYENVYFIAGGGTSLLSPGVGSVVVSTESFQVPEYEKTTYDVYPRKAVMKPFDFTDLPTRADGVDCSSALSGHRRDRRPSPRGLLSKGKAWRREPDVSMDPGHVVSAHEGPGRRAVN